MKRVWNHIRQDHQGQALVEFALVVPLLLLFLFAIVQMGFIFSGFISIEQGARAGVRAASLGENSTQIGCAIYNQINTGLFPKSATVTWQETVPQNASPQTITVTVSTAYPLLVKLPGFGSSVTMNQSYTMVQEEGSPNPQPATTVSCS
ncbi:TadE/TadG family type IV pilus assembly protein [Sulfobacillus thermosulfidooxidans]|uniref:TadE/TadG family type IV pilus assembly protein n=1 Tax=Sulfobacillus thermosulfidooxidans TaxID=28034 RepID=UPI00096BA755|nr:TadE/TadG family type IV pilus assembly protein [Sulfobacillus thermosulfidooxidans]OLZ08401.1 hypothetical protein BFX05_04020 [Sulfobacillus thermosulfidooxidans]OLZ13878.1 hypothetical protein BFX06_06060 [Sulfobacillus thermosulfidooxidans]OLZ20496.1 hypothetical protein BFX07_14855 [Sulfobacillus thermosulfidooxidans]